MPSYLLFPLVLGGSLNPSSANQQRQSRTVDCSCDRLIITARARIHVPMTLQNVMTSEVLHTHLEATYITVDSVCFFGVKQKPSLVLVNAQGVPFTYRENQVSGRMNRRVKNDWTTPRVPYRCSLRCDMRQWLSKGGGGRPGVGGVV